MVLSGLVTGAAWLCEFRALQRGEKAGNAGSYTGFLHVISESVVWTTSGTPDREW
jgi:uncharacterized membrane protein